MKRAPQMLQLFHKGDRVEVLKRDYSYNKDGVFVWFPGIVLQPSSTRCTNRPKNHIYVEFKTLRTIAIAVQDEDKDDDDDHNRTPLLREFVDLVIIHDHDNDDRGKSAIVEEVEQWGLRVVRDWDDGFWVPSLELQKPSPDSDTLSQSVKLRMKYHQKSSYPKFHKWMSVEVKSDEEGFQGSWLSILNLFTLVDAWNNDGWWVGHISKVKDGFKYKVFFENTNEEIDFEHVQLRPHQDWIKDKWVAAPNVVDLQRSSVKMGIKPRDLKLKIKCSRNIEEEKFNKGMMVEVKSDEQGYHGSWYTTAIAYPIADDRFLVEYQTLRTDDESEPLLDVAKSSYIRPCPPHIQKLDSYKLLEKVDAWYNDGWWVGLVSKVLRNLKYVVYFWTSNEEIKFGHYDLRPHQEWTGEKWITAFRMLKKSKLLKSKLGKLRGQIGGVELAPRFCNGMKVEFKRDEVEYMGSWYPAAIVKPIGNGKYLVEYQTLKTDDEIERLKEEADALCIRPCPPIV
ncbi:uncharacterized protein LOC113766304 [Coffea eugenioides]|uniref:uncharacterized protein LOC113766304 n=1 Tax=Coffea eugenioides TaxID=49369 RepID=UPI000F614F92|nr:uncharacterized protein LOC113766304 [Coffea eugenioides]